MVRRAKLYKPAGSPLIHGHLTPEGPSWPTVLGIIVSIAVVCGVVYYVWFR